MKFSVIISSYRIQDFRNLRAAVESLQAQSVVPEIIVVVGGDEELHRNALDLHCDKVLFDPPNLGATYARNMGAAAASGDVIAFLDDDAVADRHWIERLADVYSRRGCGGAGGKTLPLWECPVPRHLPDEYLWLVGATHAGFAEEVECQVRNTFANNISFRADVFCQLGGFKTDIGFSRGKLIQGEEPEICDRMVRQLGMTFWYRPDAVVYNRVPASKAKLWYWIRRSYWQGYTKRLLQDHGQALGTEKEYLSVLSDGMRERVRHPSARSYEQLAVMLLLTGATGGGYLRKMIG